MEKHIHAHGYGYWWLLKAVLFTSFTALRVDSLQLLDRASLGPNDCVSFTFETGAKGFNYEIHITGFESDVCKPSQFRWGRSIQFFSRLLLMNQLGGCGLAQGQQAVHEG